MTMRVHNLILGLATLAVLLGSCPLVKAGTIVEFDVIPTTGLVNEGGVLYQISGDIMWDTTTGEATSVSLSNGIHGQSNDFSTNTQGIANNQFAGTQTLSGVGDTLDYIVGENPFTSRQYFAFTLQTPGPGNYTGQNLILSGTGDITINAGEHSVHGNEADYSFTSLTFTPATPYVSAVPEPASLTLFGLEAVGLLWEARRRRKASAVAQV